MQNQVEVNKSGRQIVIGRNSKIWSVLTQQGLLDTQIYQAIGHRELSEFQFVPQDTVWVFSYSRNPTENDALLLHLANLKLARVVYVTSASTNVATITNCYQYPLVKSQAHLTAIKICKANILSIGLFYTQETELPCGTTAATSAQELAEFMSAPSWDHQVEFTRLFTPVTRPFKSRLEERLYVSYGKLQTLCGSYPCLLRPYDLVLRTLNMRWYGYLYLSNKLWFTTI
jgi:hypothetical protein